MAIDFQLLSEEALDLFWSWASSYKPGFIFHNASFDTLWAEVHGKPLAIEACTSVLFRLLATEGWLGQSWSLKTAMTDVLGWPEPNTEVLYSWLKSQKYGKEEMHRAPWEILGPYAALDADATVQLYQVLTRVLDSLPEKLGRVLRDYIANDCMNLLVLLREQQIKGIPVDLEGLAALNTSIGAEIEDYRQQFYSHPTIQPALASLAAAQVKAEMDAVPPQYTKAGEVTARYQKWLERIEGLKNRPMDEVFNVDSPQQLAWLFYTALGYPIRKTTDGGAASVDNKTLAQFGELGVLLSRYRKVRDRLKFATALGNVQKNGVFHPSIQMMGTVTGRSSGGNKG